MDGACLTATQVPVHPPSTPLSLAINEAGNVVYVALEGGNAAGGGNAAVDGTNGSLLNFNGTNTALGIGPRVYNNNMLYVENLTTPHVITGDATTLLPLYYDPQGNAAAISFAPQPNGFVLTLGGLAVDTSTGSVYVAISDLQNHNPGSAVAVIDPFGQNVTGTITVGQRPMGIAVNPVTHMVYVANHDSGTVSVIDAGSGTVTATIPVQASPQLVAVNSTTNRIFVSDQNSSSNEGHITVIDGATNTVVAGAGLVTHQSALTGLAADPATNRVYVTFGTYYPNPLQYVNPLNPLVVLDGSGAPAARSAQRRG